jgi:hypothetical protein
VDLLHNEIKDKVVHMAIKAHSPTAVHEEPLIQPCRVAVNEKALKAGSNTTKTTDEDDGTSESDRGDILIRGFGARGTDCILDVRVTGTDAKSYCKPAPAKVLETHGKEKKRKYLGPCLEQRRHFTPFVCYVDGMLGREATTFSKRLAAKLATKWQRPYSAVCGYINARLSIATVRATHLCLQGSRVPVHKISVRRPQWEDRAGLAQN